MAIQVAMVFSNVMKKLHLFPYEVRDMQEPENHARRTEHCQWFIHRARDFKWGRVRHMALHERGVVSFE